MELFENKFRSYLKEESKEDLFNYLTNQMENIVVTDGKIKVFPELTIDKDTFRQYTWELPLDPPMADGSDTMKFTSKIDFYRLPIELIMKVALEGGNFKSFSIANTKVDSKENVDSTIDKFLDYINRSRGYSAEIQ